MYLRITNEKIEYPYDINKLRRDEYNISFPINISDVELEKFDMHKVYLTPKPNDYTKNIVEETPQLIDGKYYQKWTMYDSSEEEINIRISFKWSEIRELRNQLLTESDWVVLVDSPFTDNEMILWKIYRSELRNITNQPNPFNVIWPNHP